MSHVCERLHERGINIHPFTVDSIAESCKVDSAIVLFKLKNSVNNHGRIAYNERKESNGNIIVLIVRDNKPVTIMFRRENQPLTCESLHVNIVIDKKTNTILDKIH